MNEEQHRVGLLAIANLAVTGVGAFLTHIHTVLEILVPAGQVAVSVVTVWYIISKIRKNKP